MVQNSILVPIDSTEQTVIALHQSYNLAKLTNSKIVLICVDEGKSKDMQKRLDAFAKEAQAKSGMPVETMVRKGNVYEEINKVADVLNPLFVMIGLSTKISISKIIGQNAFRLLEHVHHQRHLRGVQPRLVVHGRAGNDRVKIFWIALCFHQALASARRAALVIREARVLFVESLDHGLRLNRHLMHRAVSEIDDLLGVT